MHRKIRKIVTDICGVGASLMGRSLFWQTLFDFFKGQKKIEDISLIRNLFDCNFSSLLFLLPLPRGLFVDRVDRLHCDSVPLWQRSVYHSTFNVWWHQLLCRWQRPSQLQWVSADSYVLPV